MDGLLIEPNLEPTATFLQPTVGYQEGTPSRIAPFGFVEQMIPYEFQGVDHHYEPDFIVRLSNGVDLILEVKGYEEAKTAAKHHAARRWVDAVNNARDRERWTFHVCRDPQTLERELDSLSKSPPHVVPRVA